MKRKKVKNHRFGLDTLSYADGGRVRYPKRQPAKTEDSPPERRIDDVYARSGDRAKGIANAYKGPLVPEGEEYPAHDFSKLQRRI